MNAHNLDPLNTRESKASIINRITKEAEKGFSCELSLVDALEFRMDQYGLNQKEFSGIIGMTQPEFSEVMAGKRKLTRKAAHRCAAIGVDKEAILADIYRDKIGV